jgi:hypothetical protein
MRHLMVGLKLNKRKDLEETISSFEKQGWSVAAFGTTFGGKRLVLVDNGKRYEHEIVSASWKSLSEMAETVAEKEKEGWEVSAIGECFGSNLLILKREIA